MKSSTRMLLGLMAMLILAIVVVNIIFKSRVDKFIDHESNSSVPQQVDTVARTSKPTNNLP